MFYIYLEIINLFTLILFTLICFEQIEKKVNLRKIIYFTSLTLLALLNYFEYYMFIKDEASYLVIVVSLLIIIIITTFLVLSIFSFQFLRLRILFIPFFLILFIFRIISLNISVENSNNYLLDNNILIIHILSSLLAYSFLTISSVTSFCIFIQSFYLKKMRTNKNFLTPLPSINESEVITISLLNFTVLLLSISLVTGYFYFKEDSNNLGFFFNSKSLISILALLLITVILTVRSLVGISGQTMFKLIILCYFLINFSYFGVRFLY